MSRTSSHDKPATYPQVGRVEDVTMEGGEPFNWSALVPHVIHPLKVEIVEALHWIGQPLSASDMTKVIDDEKFGLSHVSYHMGKLAKAGAIHVVRTRQVRSTIEKFYFFPAGK